MPVAAGFDYAYRPDLTPAMIKAVGGSFIMRYLSSYPWPKTTNRTEVAAMLAGGVSVGFVWEDNADRPAFGAAAGAADGAVAGAQANAIGVPKSVPLFYAMDVDDRAYGPGVYDSIRAYGVAFAKASGHFAFPYGSVRVIDAIGGGWQTEAWSDGAVSAKAFLLQRAAPSPHLADTDDNVLFNSYALWTPQSVLAEQAAVAAFLKALAEAKRRPPMTSVGYPRITASDHTHPLALAELKRKLKKINPKVDVSTDAATAKAVEQARTFLKITDPKPWVGDDFWRVLSYAESIEKK